MPATQCWSSIFACGSLVGEAMLSSAGKVDSRGGESRQAGRDQMRNLREPSGDKEVEQDDGASSIKSKYVVWCFLVKRSVQNGRGGGGAPGADKLRCSWS